jgi:hypothetical protein
LQDVIRLRQDRWQDIRRLRDVLGGIEDALREGNQRALDKAAHDVRLASVDLAKGTTVATISRWITYLATPLAIIEQIVGSTPIGLGVTLAGTATTMIAESAIRRNTDLSASL